MTQVSYYDMTNRSRLEIKHVLQTEKNNLFLVERKLRGSAGSKFQMSSCQISLKSIEKFRLVEHRFFYFI